MERRQQQPRDMIFRNMIGDQPVDSESFQAYRQALAAYDAGCYELPEHDPVAGMWVVPERVIEPVSNNAPDIQYK